MIIVDKKIVFALSIMVVAFLYFYDIGNINAMRQGTEGFYLQISKEMFNKGSALTPYYNNVEHWSKPPLHFWNALAYYKISGNPSIFWARVSVAVLALAGLFLISLWNKKHFNIPTITTFLILASSFGFLKYSRIYMMEIPLTIISTLASLYFYSYLQDRKDSVLILAIFCLGLSTLVKGPVSLVMCVGSVLLYFAINSDYRNMDAIKSLLIWSISGLLIGSIWYFACYFEYGNHFLEYFFLKENFGKFTAKSYPITSIIQGLFLYSLPWVFFIPHLFSNIHKSSLFLVIHFIFFFLLWFIPSQRSHHYAIPSLTFFLLLITNSLHYAKKTDATYQFGKITVGVLYTLASLLILTSIFLIKDLHISNLSFSITLSFFIAATLVIFFVEELPIKAFFVMISLSSFWVVYIPNFYLPIVPPSVAQSLENKPIGVVFRKPYYISEALDKDVQIVSEFNANQYLESNSTYLFILESEYKNQKLEAYPPIKKWPIWKRGNGFFKIVSAIGDGSIQNLVENMYLIEK